MSSILESTSEIYLPESCADAFGAPYRLMEKIVSRSVADTWHEAKLEWRLACIFIADELGRCLCGHPIIAHCVLFNHENGNQAVVGNVCVTRFLGIDSEQLFVALRRITKNKAAALNAEAVEYAHSKGWIDEWKRHFYLNTLRKRKLSLKQRAKRIEINELVLQRTREGWHDA